MGIQILGDIADVLLRAVLADEIDPDQHSETDLESIWRISNILLFASDSEPPTAEVLSDDDAASDEFERRFRNMKAMEAEAKAEWAETQ